VYKEILNGASAPSPSSSQIRKAGAVAENVEKEKTSKGSGGIRVPGPIAVYCLPGVSITLPTAMGPVSFQPAFLSAKELSQPG
jgi:hypothetical protein